MVEIESAWPRYPDYRIDLERCADQGQVWAGDLLLAESNHCLLVKETGHVDRLYFPEEDVRWELFAATDHHTICPFKGQANYWSLRQGGGDNVVWGHRTPFSEVAGLKGYVCFYHERLKVVRNETWDDGTVVSTPFPAWGDAAELIRLMDVQPEGKGRYTAPAYGDTARDVVEGGQMLGEAIVAASKTIPQQRVTSASMIFSKAASFAEPVDLDVEVLRAGRTFSTVEVRLNQKGSLRAAGLVLMDAGAPELIRHATAMPEVPGPEQAVPYVDFAVSGRELRVLDAAYDDIPDRIRPPRIYVWARFRDAPAEPYLHRALLAQSTTHWTIAAAVLPHPGVSESAAHVTLSTAIMQITCNFHDEVDVTDWLLYANPAIWAGRGLAQGQGQVFSQDGRLVASYSVQAMVRAFEREPAAMGKDARTVM